MKHLAPFFSVVLIFYGSMMAQAGSVVVYPAPAGEPLSTAYQVTVEGQPVPVYLTKVASSDPVRRLKAMDDKIHSGDYFELASFASFDMQGTVTVKVTCPEEVESVKILPTSRNLKPVIKGDSIYLPISEPGPLTVEVNGKWAGALHLFANPPDENAPAPGTPGVIYFGPGIHEVTHLVVTNNQTVYVAGGAIVRGVIGVDEPYSVNSREGQRNYSPTLVLQGTNIVLRGRGIIDGSSCPIHARHLIVVQGTNIALEGVILRDSSTWNMPIRQSQGITVKNVKVLGYRANSDGMDVCNSRDVDIEDCFVRTLDDLIVVKSQGANASSHIMVNHCVLWNEVAHALSIGAELRQNIDDVLFTNCDIIQDKGRDWTMRVYHCDSARITNVRFENIRVEESPRLISLWIGKAQWSRDKERGHIDGVTFKDITATVNALHIDLKGFDDTHLVENVHFEDVVVNGRPLVPADITANAFVKNVTVKP